MPGWRGGCLMLCQDFLPRCWSHNTHKICSCASSPPPRRPAPFRVAPLPQTKGDTDRFFFTFIHVKCPCHMIRFSMSGGARGQASQSLSAESFSAYGWRWWCRGLAYSEGKSQQSLQNVLFQCKLFEGGR